MTQTDELVLWTHEQNRPPRLTDMRVLVVNADLGF